MRTCLFIALVVTQAGTASAQVAGRVHDVHSNGAVSGAIVEMIGSGPRRTTYSTAEGVYSFTALPAGEACLRVVHPGYETASVCVIVNGHSLVLDLPLRPRPLVLNGIEVIGVRTGALEPARYADSPASTGTDKPVGTPAVLVPATTGGGVMASLSAGPAPGHPDRQRAHTLHIWSAGADKGAVALDDAVLSAPLHLGALLPPIDPELLGSAVMRAGGAAARHDGGAAQLLDLSTRAAATGSSVWLAADLLSTRAGLEMATSDAGLIAGGRRVNHEIIDGALAHPFGYAYHDGIARADLRIGNRVALRATAFVTEEQLRIPRDQGQDHALWSNAVASAGARISGDGADYSAKASFSRGRADLPVLSVLGGHQAATLDRLSLTAGSIIGVRGLPLSTGVDVEHVTFRRAFRSTGSGEGGQESLTCDTGTRCAAGASIAAAYVDVALPAHGLVMVRVGARMRYAASEQRTDMLPRILLSYRLGSGSLSLGAGDFTQSVLLDTDGVVRLTTARARHVEFGVIQQFDGTLLKAAVHTRRGVAAGPEEAAGSVPGADIGIVQRTPFGNVSANYGLERVLSGQAGSATYRRTAALGLGLQGNVLRGELVASYAAGFPATSIVLERPTEFLGFLAAPREAAISQDSSEQSYLRVDASVGAQWKLRIGARTATVMPYIRVHNAFDDRESVFYFRERDGTSRPLARLPVLPVLGVRLEF